MTILHSLKPYQKHYHDYNLWLTPDLLLQQYRTHIQRTTHDLHAVKITSPAKGQEVAVGKDLLISGSSADNTTTPDCQVSVIANGIKPYHNALPSGSGGPANNYSKWSFNLTPVYTTIKQGRNKITAKFSCPSDPSLLDHTSVNVKSSECC